MVRRILLTLALLGVTQTIPSTPTIDALIKEIEAVRAALITPPATTTVTVTTATELQAALDGAATTIQVQPGTYSGNFTIKAKPTPTTVRGLTVTGRAQPGLPYPKLVAKDPLLPVLSALAGAHDYTFVGLEFTGVAGDRDLMIMGPISMTTLAQAPINITFDQVYAHGVAGRGHRGLQFNAVNGTVTRSYFAEFVEQGRDSQALGMGVGPGPYTITDNYLEASGENVMFGGVDPLIPNLSPGPALVSGNTVFKPLAWKAQYPGSVKNLFEVKNGHDLTIVNNVFENVWTDSQAGSAILFTVRNQDGGCPWCNVRDIVFRCNQVRGVENLAISILATDDSHPSGTAENLTITNNLVTKATAGIQITAGGKHIVVIGNVLPGLLRSFLALSGTPPGSGFQFTNNYVASGSYGIAGDNTTPGAASLAAFQPGAVFTGNTIDKSAERSISYPPGNTLVAPGTVAASNWTGCPAL
jgi:hypothetical protein